MNLDLIKNLRNGLLLESRNILIPWRATFSELKEMGSPKIISQSNKRTDLVWENEKILNGFVVDLIVMKWSGLISLNRKFKYAFAYISQEDFVKLKEKLDLELGFIPKYKRKNQLEYIFSYDLDYVTITLQENDRFGPYWTIEIKHKSSLNGILK
jgi:hypothetical protein